MFAVERWNGEDDGQQPRATGVSLQVLNARLRERAASRLKGSAHSGDRNTKRSREEEEDQNVIVGPAPVEETADAVVPEPPSKKRKKTQKSKEAVTGGGQQDKNHRGPSGAGLKEGIIHPDTLIGGDIQTEQEAEAPPRGHKKRELLRQEATAAEAHSDATATGGDSCPENGREGLPVRVGAEGKGGASMGLKAEGSGEEEAKERKRRRKEKKEKKKREKERRRLGLGEVPHDVPGASDGGGDLAGGDFPEDEEEAEEAAGIEQNEGAGTSLRALEEEPLDSPTLRSFGRYDSMEDVEGGVEQEEEQQEEEEEEEEGEGEGPGGRGQGLGQDMEDVEEEEKEEEEAITAAADDAPLEEEALPRREAPPKATKAPPVLPWMRTPVEIGEADALQLDSVPHIDPRLVAALQRSGIQTLFPVQATVWRHMAGPGGAARDLCVCAPTGSGKTLSYVLPVVQGLSTRVVRRLRALIVVPTRDLATQVREVFEGLATAVGLSVGLAIGQTSLALEASQLVSSPHDDVDHDLAQSACGLWPELHDIWHSRVDVLVATPGRLMDHVDATPGFSLQHLRYLVVDETDRLLRQAYQDWLPTVLAAANAGCDKWQKGDASVPRPFGPICTVRRECKEAGLRGVLTPRLVKLLLSATLTRDPAKIMRLQLHHPLYIASSATDHRYKLPPQLQEYKLVCKAGEKPLVLAALLQQLAAQSTIVFTASVEATHRLFLLLRAFADQLPVRCVEYSSLQHQRARSAALEEFRSGKAQVLVASDAMTRGMDVESVMNVVSYDVPVYIKTYVHRAGRTARAGRPGCAFTIMRKEEVRHFKGLLRKADNNFCRDYLLPPQALEDLTPAYLAALEELKGAVEEEAAAAAGMKQTKRDK